MSPEKLTAKIRIIINKPRKQYALLKNHQYWNQLCSSLDVIEDTQLAIDSYRNKTLEAKTETLYLLVYGLFQALFLQQDAVTHLNQALGNVVIDLKKDHPNLYKIRQIRNESIGHPTNKGSGESFHFISRSTLTYEGFQLLSFFKDKKHVFKIIETFSCIDSQKSDICSILESILEKLQEEEVAHKNQFKEEKLEDIFPKIIHYYFEKIFECIRNPVNYPAPLGLEHIALIEGILKQFEDALNKRGIELATYDAIEYSYKQLSRRFIRIKDFFVNQCQYTTEDVVDFWEAAKREVDDLVQFAKEIDDEYSSF